MDDLPREDMPRTDTSPCLWSHETWITLRCSFKNALELMIPTIDKYYMNIYSCNILKMDGLPREDILKPDTLPYLWSHDICKTCICSFKITLKLLNPVFDRY